MRPIYQTAALLCFAVLLVPVTSQAKLPGLLQRYEIFYTYPVTFADYTRTDKFQLNSDAAYDTTYTQKVTSKFSFGAGIGTYIPLRQLGRKSKLCLDIAFLYNAFTFKYNTVLPNGFDTATGGLDYNDAIPFDGIIMHMALPIGLSARIGCDAMQDKKIRFCWAAGAGVYPSYNLATDLDNVDAQFGVQPYVKTEVGVFAGICFKLRAMYSFLNIPYLESGSKNTFFGYGNEANTKLTGKGVLNLSLVIMPFSFTWKKSEWWNTF